MSSQEIIDDFHRLFYQSWLKTWANTNWLGVSVEKPAHDLWIYQEIITQLRPDLIIETGTRFGGSALYMATVCDALGHGRIATIDVQALAATDTCRPPHPRISYITGSSTAPETVERVTALIKPDDVVMVILDSDHSMNHVADELRIYADLVTEDSYLIVEDTHLNGHPIDDGTGPGPWEAAEVFLAGAPDFAPDPSCEKFLHTFSPRGYLKRSPAESAANRLLRAEAALAECSAEAEKLRSRVGSAETAVEEEHRRAEEARLQAEEERLRAEAEQRRADEASTAADRTAAAFATVQKEAAAAVAAIRRVEQSPSWRLTAPLRRLKRLVAGRDS